MLVGPIANVAGQFLKNRAEKVKAKQELAVAKIQAQTKKVQSDANWEEKAMDASQDSIKDELWTVLFIGLIIACFVPSLQPPMVTIALVSCCRCPCQPSLGVRPRP